MHKTVRLYFLIVCLTFCFESMTKPIAIEKERIWVIDQDGAIINWSFESEDQLNFYKPENQIRYTTISAGFNYVLALDYEGKIWRWDEDKFIQISTIQQTFEAISANFDHALLLDTEGKVWHYEDNILDLKPEKIENLTNISAISAGLQHDLALDTNGQIWSWGRGDNGQLGHQILNDEVIPTRINSPERFVAIAAGSYHSLAIDAHGRVWLWGNMNQKNIDATLEHASLGMLEFNEHAIKIEAAEDFSMVLDNNGDIWTWGKLANGNLGHGDNSAYMNVPTKVEKFSDHLIVDVVVSDFNSLFLDQAGNIWKYGDRRLFENLLANLHLVDPTDVFKKSFRLIKLPKPALVPLFVPVKSAKK